MPIAESVAQETERLLHAHLPEDFAGRLAAKAHRLHPRHRHFKKMLHCPGNSGQINLLMYMRHWTCGWLKRERYALFKKLPWSYGQGLRLPTTAPRVPMTLAQSLARARSVDLSTNQQPLVTPGRARTQGSHFSR